MACNASKGGLRHCWGLRLSAVLKNQIAKNYKLHAKMHFNTKHLGKQRTENRQQKDGATDKRQGTYSHTDSRTLQACVLARTMAHLWPS